MFIQVFGLVWILWLGFEEIELLSFNGNIFCAKTNNLYSFTKIIPRLDVVYVWRELIDTYTPLVILLKFSLVLYTKHIAIGSNY